MKVITEEQLRQMSVTSSMPNATSVINTILSECQELDQLSVTRLRPMSDAPVNTWILIYDGERFFQTKIRANTKLVKLERNESQEYAGWIPLPKYEPEQS